MGAEPVALGTLSSRNCEIRDTLLTIPRRLSEYETIGFWQGIGGLTRVLQELGEN